MVPRASTVDAGAIHPFDDIVSSRLGSHGTRGAIPSTKYIA